MADKQKPEASRQQSPSTGASQNKPFLRSNLVLSLLQNEASHGPGDDQALKALDLQKATFDKASDDASLAAAIQHLPGASLVQRAKLLHDLAVISDDNRDIIEGLSGNSGNEDLRSIARKFSAKDLTEVVLSHSLQGSEVATNGGRHSPDAANSKPAVRTPLNAQSKDALTTGLRLRKRLFQQEPIAVLSRMVEEDEIPTGKVGGQDSARVKKTVIELLDAHAAAGAIPTKPTMLTLSRRKANDPAETADTHAVQMVSGIQRLRALTTEPEVIPAAMKAGFSSARQIASVPLSHFAQKVSKFMGDNLPTDESLQVASQMHIRAQNNAFHTNMTLTAALQALRGTGIRAIDGDSWVRGMPSKMPVVNLNGKRAPVDLRQLFGSIDYCECSDCSSVLSPAAYFVELLQFLRNNNLEEQYQPGWKGTALEMLFRRRPDLADVELSCANTNTVLPYIDLSNEIMESFVMHRTAYAASNPKQTELDGFNTEDDMVSSMLLAQPQNVNYRAYCVLYDAVYPFTLPYCQPLDELRIFLGFMGVSLYDIRDVFRKGSEDLPGRMAAFEREARNRALAAEALLLSHKDFEILTKEAFYSNKYLQYVEKKQLTADEIAQKLHLAPVHVYWGYQAEADMLSLDETLQKGLTFVEKQFLPHSGIAYADLVQLLKTQYMNPNMPKGWALLFMQRLRFSYAFLQTLVDTNPVKKYDRLVAYLVKAQPMAEMFEQLRKRYLRSLPNQAQAVNFTDLSQSSALSVRTGCCSCSAEEIWRCWVHQYFDLVGQLLVLDSRDGPVFETEGWLVLHKDEPAPSVPRIALRVSPTANLPGGRELAAAPGTLDTPGDTDIGYLHRDGTITLTADDGTESTVGYITSEGRVVDNDGVLFSVKYHLDDPSVSLQVWNVSKTSIIGDIGQADSMVHLFSVEKVAQWQAIQDTCSISKIRLVRLNAQPPTKLDFDRMHRFIRLWRRLAWSMDDLDQALSGLANIADTEDEAEMECASTTSSDDPASTPASSPSRPADPPPVTWDDLNDECGCDEECNGDVDACGTNDKSCPLHDNAWTPPKATNISPSFIKQLAAVQKLVQRTSLELPKLLSFWSDIPTHGQPKSLYERLFLTRDLAALDDVFAADANGNYLTSSGSELIQNHLPVIMAAFHVRKAEDMADILKLEAMGADAKLTVHSLSLLYRWVLLAQVLGIKVSQLKGFRNVFGDPFEGGAIRMVKVLDDWDKLSDSGLSLRQLAFVIANQDLDSSSSLVPSQVTMLGTVKKLLDGLADIDTSYPDKLADQEQKPEFVANLLALLYDPDTAQGVAGLLNGTSAWTTNAPVGLTVVIPPELTKVKYSSDPGGPASPPSASLQMTGIMTAEEVEGAKHLVAGNQAWASAVDRLMKKPSRWFQDTLAGMFSATPDAQQVLLAGDIATINPVPTVADPTPSPIIGTTPKKTAAFLKVFLPTLRNTLSDRLIVETMSGVAGVAAEITSILLSSILKVGGNAAMSTLQKLRQAQISPAPGWKGFLVPPSTDSFTFFVTSDIDPGSIQLDGFSVTFKQQDDPTNVWVSQPVKLQSGILYRLSLGTTSLSTLSWKTTAGAKISIPSSSVLPDVLSGNLREVFVKLVKAGIVIGSFSMTDVELVYLTDNKQDFADLDFNALTFPAWQRLQAYVSLRNDVQVTSTPLISLFQFAARSNPSVADVQAKIIEVTRWDSDATLLNSLMQADAFGLTTADFRNEKALIKLKKAMNLTKKVVLPVSALFLLAKPVRKFWDLHQDAINLRKAIRSQFTADEWDQAVQPLFNTLREDQKNALVAFILVDQDVVQQGVTDADGLFEFFLIDVQMSSCLQTSRLKQAISSVQQFVQRCLLGMELLPTQTDGTPVPIDSDRWNWMSKQPVFAAARQVFLWKENVLFPSLRDDQSPIYKDFESELLQKDVDAETVASALRSYLFKLDEVANLQAVGLFLDDPPIDSDGRKPPRTLHIVSRTLGAPFIYYYRQVNLDSTLWTPWEKVNADIPNLIAESSDKVDGRGTVLGAENGTYVIPVVWSGRILLFFPQIAKKTIPVPLPDDTITNTAATKKPADVQAKETWEVKMCFVERLKGAWTSKTISAEGVMEDIVDPSTYQIPAVSDFAFIQRIYTQGTSDNLSIDVCCHVRQPLPGPGATGPPGPDAPSTCIGRFDFSNGRLKKSPTRPTGPLLKSAVSVSHFGNVDLDGGLLGSDETQLHSWQAKTSDGVPELYNTYPYISHAKGAVLPTAVLHLGDTQTINLTHDFVHEALGSLSATDDLKAFYKQLGKLAAASNLGEAFGSDDSTKYHELAAPMAIYNWEMMFYIPWILMERYSEKNQFAQAIDMCELIFAPLANSAKPSDCWNFLPFREVVAKDDLDSFFQSLLPNKANRDVTEWRDNPFVPFPLARARPVAFMKCIVMKYMQLFTDFGDYYFRQNSLESLPLAIQCYVQASHVFGPSGQMIPKRGKKETETYRRLLERFDAFDNVMVDLELEFPFSNQISIATPIGFTGKLDTPVDLANIFGSETSKYFCIPNNPKLQAIRDTVDDRLYKIRHCQDINGVVRMLPLWDPPIDPALLVQATAAGLSIDQVLNDLNAPMPNYRFYFLMQKAYEACNDLKSFLSGFLSIKEKSDTEALVALRQRHEVQMTELFMDIKTAQLDEAKQALAVLQANRTGVEYRMKHFLKLLGEDLSKVPADETAPFTEVEMTYDQLSDDSGLKLTTGEKEEIALAGVGTGLSAGVGVIETGAATAHAVPTSYTIAAPWGVGEAIAIGGSNAGNASGAVARGIRTAADLSTALSASAARRTGLMRAMQDRVQMANSAGYDIKSIDAQIIAQRIRIDVATKEISNHQQSIDNSREVNDFLSTKYTNQQLYQYLEANSRQLCKRSYDLAYELAQRAEKVYHFERPAEADKSFVSYGYWDPAHDGLLSGDALSLSLRQMEAAYQATRGHDFEVSKAVSLRLLAPLQLMQLRETGTCEFAIPEMQYDLDFPNQYMRRIKTVALNIPCVVGAYAGVNCTLRLLESKFRNTSIVKDSASYPESIDGDGPDPRFSITSVPISAIATSNAQGDSGVFEVSFKDERFLPFEGAGAVSRWQINLPALNGPNSPALRAFDYSTITDVILTIRYTSLDGGDKLASVAAGAVRTVAQKMEDVSQEQGLYCILDLAAEFATEWARFSAKPATIDTDRVLRMTNINERLPALTRGAKKVTAAEIWLFSTSELPEGSAVIEPVAKAGAVAGGGGDPIAFSSHTTVGSLHKYSATDLDVELAGSWDLKIKAPGASSVKLGDRGQGVWVVVRYIVKLN